MSREFTSAALRSQILQILIFGSWGFRLSFERVRGGRVPREESYGSILDLLYTAAGDTTVWNHFIEQTTRALEASRSALVAIDPSERRYFIDSKFGFCSDEVQQYSGYYGTIDPWYLAYKRSGRSGFVGKGTTLCRPSDIETSEFYNDYGIRIDNRYVACIIFDHGGGAITALTAMREARRGDFDQKQVRFLHKLAPHLTRALQLHGRMLDLKDAVAGSARMMDAVDLGLLGLDEEEKVCFTNTKAEQMLRHGKAFICRDGRIVARDPVCAEKLHQLFKTTCSLELEAPVPSGCTVRAGDRVLHVTMTAIRRSDRVLPAKMKVFVTITDLTAQPKAREALLADLFRITPAEARVVMLLLAGMETKEIAMHTGTTQNTVRFQLKSIYRKTGTSGQNQLVRLVSLLPGGPSDGYASRDKVSSD
jgi:DNA-binding CsgD family transcriptional regulator